MSIVGEGTSCPSWEKEHHVHHGRRNIIFIKRKGHVAYHGEKIIVHHRKEDILSIMRKGIHIYILRMKGVHPSKTNTMSIKGKWKYVYHGKRDLLL